MSHAGPTVQAASSAASLPTMVIAQRYLGLALSFDYLSNGRGHQQARRTVGDRMARRGAKLVSRPGNT